MARKLDFISGYLPGTGTPSTETMMREAFLRTARDTFDNFGFEDYAVEQVRGALDMIEKYVEVRKELE